MRDAALVARDRAGEAAHRLATLRTELATADRRIADLVTTQRGIADDRAREGSLARDAAEALARLGEEVAALTVGIATDAAALPGLDAALGEAERVGRDAEVALAQALARQAGETAEARVAAAALQAVEARQARVTREIDAVARQRAMLGDAGPIAAARDAAASARIAATAEADRARAALVRAEEDETAAAADRRAADASVSAARAALAAVEAEDAALERATRRTDRSRLSDRINVAPGYEHALAAGIGDELDAAADAWAGSAPEPGDPPAPVGTVPLADRVEGPATLARRLAQPSRARCAPQRACRSVANLPVSGPRVDDNLPRAQRTHYHARRW